MHNILIVRSDGMIPNLEPSISGSPKLRARPMPSLPRRTFPVSSGEVVYTHHITGNFLSIPISRNIKIESLSRLELETVYFGDWETPQDERFRGHSIMAYTEGKAFPQHLMNFCDRGLPLTDLEVLEVSKGLADFLNTTLVVLCR